MLGKSFWKTAADAPTAIALVDPNDTEWSSGRLLEDSNRLVHGLRARGLRAGDSIVTLLGNGIDIIQLTLACTQAGWRMIPLNPRLRGREIARIVYQSAASAVVGSARHRRLYVAAAEGEWSPRWFTVGSDADPDSLEAVRKDQPPDLPGDRRPGLVMTYTAGTTGDPKGVLRPTPQDIDPDTLASAYTWFLTLFGIEPLRENVHLVVSPLCHTGVLNFAMNSLHMGHKLVLMDRWSPEGMLDRVRRHRVTTTHMVPAQFQWLLALPETTRTAADVSSLRHVVHSAAPCAPDVKRRMLEWWGPVIYEYYAAAEGGGTLATPEDWLRKPGTVGRPWPISEIRILDDGGNLCLPGVEGTVWLRMGGYTFEYHNDREATDATWRDGFFTVGDIGYLDGDGYLFLCDRKADVIIFGGMNVYPAEVESMLLTHPDIVDAAVVGVPDVVWGEQVKAMVVPAPGRPTGRAAARELMAFCRKRLAHYKCPKQLDFVEALPRDPTGKLLRRELRTPYWSQRARNI